jgi:uncharacterized protein YbaP (TraB family)
MTGRILGLHAPELTTSPDGAYAMKHLTRAARRIARAAALALALAAPAHAEDAKPAPATRCGGADMLAELQTTSPDLYNQVMDQTKALSNTEAVLWKVEKDGLPTSYLFGTMHLSDPRLTTLSPKVKEAIRGSKRVALEVADLSDNALATAMSKAAELVVYTDGRNLKSQLSEDEFKKVEGVVTKSGMPGEFATLFRPWIVSMLLTLSDCEKKQVAAGAPVLDMQIAAEAQKDGVEVTGLETVESQLAALAAVPDDQQVQMLKVALNYVDRADDMMETMVQMYVKRQLGAAMPFQLALAAKQGVQPSAFEGFKQTLLVDRNAGMKKASLPLLEKGATFIAVGALHLPGPTGLVALLRDAGYTVTPIE